MKSNNFHLEIIPINKILVHEEYDVSRAKPLVKALERDGKLSNPIIVASLDDGRYLQLDGMNRLSAFKMLGLKTIAAQVIDYNDQEVVDLSTWTHLFKADKKSLLKFLDGIKGVTYKEGSTENVGYRYIKEKGMGRLCTICCKDETVILVFFKGSLVEKVNKLVEIVKFYKEGIFRDVLIPYLNIGDIYFLFREHPKTNMMMVFPTFTRHQIIKVVQKGALFPAGLTRHLVRRRCLNVSTDLELFKNGSLKEQNKKLDKEFNSRRFRVYEEEIVYFE